MKNKSTEAIRSFFGEHQRRISFQAPVVISFQEKLRKEIALSFSTKEQVRKILQSLLESTFPHKNLNEAVDLIETILKDKIEHISQIENAAHNNKIEEYEQYIADQEGYFKSCQKKSKYKNEWENDNWEHRENYPTENIVFCNGKYYKRSFNAEIGTYSYCEIYLTSQNYIYNNEEFNVDGLSV